MSEYQDAVSGEVNRRLEKAAGELQQKYASGQGGNDASVNGPTGTAYREAEEAARRERAANAYKGPSKSELRAQAVANAKVERSIDNDEEFEDDPELQRLRERRLKQLQSQKEERLSNIGKGHGQYREISQDEFLTEVTGSLRVVCHFYHRDFQRCKIMDMHIAKLAPKHIEAKFVKIDGEKAPFFVEKLKVRTMPTLVCFEDGVAKEKVMGFEGLSDTMPAGKEDEWPTVYLAKLLADKGVLDRENVVDEEDLLRKQQARMDAMREAFMRGALMGDEDDEDIDNLDV